MAELLGPKRLRALFDEHGVRPRKELGQNFVIDPNTIRKIVSYAGLTGAETVLEIGAGAGSLTLGLAGAAGRVVALEFDSALVPVLRSTTQDLVNVTVVEADALRYDYESSGAEVVVGNLPYNLASTLVVKVLEEAPRVHSLTVMVQKEVGARLAAAPGSKEYGAVTLLVAYFAEAKVAARVSRNAFYPVPGVDSVIVQLTRRAVPDVSYSPFGEVVKAAFSQRRKTLRNSLGSITRTMEESESMIERAGIAPSVRAEELDLDAFVALAREWP